MEEPIIISPDTKYIAIEGPVGSGKTSPRKKLADHLEGKLILEQPETNPFLENFYKDQIECIANRAFILISKIKVT